MPMPKCLSEGFVLQRRRGSLASHGLLREGGLKDALRSPGRLCDWALQFLFFLLRGGAHAKGASVKAGTHCVQWGGRTAPGP